MTDNIQPSLFISHGTMYEAFKSEKLKQDFAKIREEHFKILPSTIVVFSGHWQTDDIKVTTAAIMQQMEEGFPADFTTSYSAPGNLDLSNRIINLLNDNQITAKSDNSKMFDHGALIPLLLLFPEGNIPVIQISQQYNLDPVFHKRIAEILAPLRNENVLFIGSGGLVHNRNEIVKMSGHDLEPSGWAKDFDDFITSELISNNTISNKIIDAYENKNFDISHPTTEHFLPIVFASAMAIKATKIYEAFQWKNLSMSAFKFE
jgi:4,5-DOPA dioxygenase extradiol